MNYFTEGEGYWWTVDSMYPTYPMSEQLSMNSPKRSVPTSSHAYYSNYSYGPLAEDPLAGPSTGITTRQRARAKHARVTKKDKNKSVNKPHVPTKSFTKKFPCPKCGRSYTLRENLARHLRYECGVEPKFQCKVCLRKIKRKDDFHRHLRLHCKSDLI